MADDFHTGICSLNWWNLARSEGIDGSATSSATPSASCSAAIIDMGGGGEGFSWTAAEMGEGKAGSCDEPAGSASGSSITFQDTHKARTPDNMVGGPMIKPTFQVPGFGLSPSGMDWTQPSLLRRNGRGETSFQAMLQDDLNSKPFFRHDPSIDSDEAQAGSAYPFKGMNQSFLLDQHRLSSSGSPVDCGIDRLDSFQLSAASYGTVLQTLIEPDTKPQRSIYDNPSVSYQSPMTGYRGIPTELSQPTWPKSSQFLKASPPNHRSTNQLQFSNNTPFWNASAAGFYPPTPTQFTVQTFEQKPNSSKSNSEGARDSSSSSSMTKKSSSSEPAPKKPRIETPSPLPTFKVRKEKLGDRITALQQLVSPFGKTDTASVLHDAIEYIKFLHDQVNVLSTPYLKNGHPMQQQNPDKLKIGEGPKQDLRSRGLCLVPISSTYQVASETPVDFWNPTFGGTYR